MRGGRPSRRSVLTMILCSVTFAASVAVGRAEEKPDDGALKRGDQKLKLNEVEIQGELEKPKIFFILPKAERDAQTKTRRFRFYPDILEPLDRDRFEEEARVLYQHGIPAE
jgi:hypothetical protein